MKRTLLMLFAAFTLGTTLNAQTKDTTPTKQRPDRTEIMTKRVNRIADNLKLDDKTQAWFVPLYMEYQNEMRNIYRSVKNKTTKNAAVTSLNDQESLQLIENSFKMQEEKVKVQRKYYNKFKERLTPQQLVSIFYQCPAHKAYKAGKKAYTKLDKKKRAELIKRYKSQKKNANKAA